MASADFDASEILGKLRTIDPKMKAFLFGASTLYASKAQSYARQNALWTDRTGNARNSLFGKAIRGGGTYGFTLFGSMPYQPYLEARFSGRYAIIGPTLNAVGPQFISFATRAFSEIF